MTAETNRRQGLSGTARLWPPHVWAGPQRPRGGYCCKSPGDLTKAQSLNRRGVILESLLLCGQSV